jgi:hypothetical protein
MKFLKCMILFGSEYFVLQFALDNYKCVYRWKKTRLTSKMDVNLRKKLVKCYIWSIPLYGAETWDASESRLEIPAKF